MASLTPGLWQLVDGQLVNLATLEQVPYEVNPREDQTYRLVYSLSGDRSQAVPLSGATIDAPVAVFTEPVPRAGVTATAIDDAASVAFYIKKGTAGQSVLERIETTAPFDLKGASGETANLWNPPKDTYTVRALVTRIKGTTQDISVGVTSTIGDDEPPPPPPPDGRPSAATTGPRYALTNSGTVTTTRDGQVIERLNISGSINVRHRNVTIRDCRVTSGSGSFGINPDSRDANDQPIVGLLIEYTEVVMTNSAGGNACIGKISSRDGGTTHGSKMTVRYCHLRGHGDGIKAGDYGLYEHNYIHVIRAPGTKKHVDGIQGSGNEHWTARYNWIDQAYSGGHNSAIFCQPYTGTSNVYVDDVVIHSNWVNGGVYTIQTGEWKANPKDGQGNPGAGPAMTNIVIRDNIFYRDYHYGVFMPRGGPTGADVSGGSGVRGGVWADNGQQVPTGTI